MAGEPNHERTLFKVITICSAIALGGLGAIIGSMKDFLHGDAALSVSWRSAVGFVIGFVIGWIFWRILFARTSRTDHRD